MMYNNKNKQSKNKEIRIKKRRRRRRNTMKGMRWIGRIEEEKGNHKMMKTGSNGRNT